MTAVTLPVLSDEGGLSKYLNAIKKFPLLKPEEEYRLAMRWREHGEREAAHKLVTSHLRLVAKIAMKYRGYGLPMADLISEGNIGLMKAIRKFEPERGFRLSTYAIWWIKAAVTEHVLRSWSLVKMGTVSAQKKLFFSLRKAKNKLKIFGSSELDGEQAAMLAETLKVPVRDVVQMNRRLTARDFSLNAPVSSEGESKEFQDTLIDDSPSPEAVAAKSEEAQIRGALLREALATLPDRERHILTQRRLRDDPVTLETLGNELGVSRERIRQLEVRAFEKIQKKVRKSLSVA